MIRVRSALNALALHRVFQSLHFDWRALKDAFRDPYRPEQHYMRGPGPKHRAKHASSGGAPICSS
jgi:hypothetical protein